MNANQKVVLTEVAYQVRAGIAAPLALVNACRLLDVRPEWWATVVCKPLSEVVVTLSDNAQVDRLIERWRERIPMTTPPRGAKRKRAA